VAVSQGKMIFGYIIPLRAGLHSQQKSQTSSGSEVWQNLGNFANTTNSSAHDQVS
jgi:hypothetical protein